MKIVLEKGQNLFFTSDTHYNHSNICSDVDYRLTCLVNQAQSKVAIVLILVLLHFANAVVGCFDFHDVSISNINNNAKILLEIKL